MAELEIHIKNLEYKIKLLVKQYQQLQNENIDLKKKIESLKHGFVEKTERAQKLQQQVDLLNFSAASMDAENKKNLEQRIDNYLKEIDKCLALLNP